MGLAINLDYDGFEHHLTNENKRNARQILCYARRYGHILQTGNASELLQLTPNMRRHCMEALVYFSKYLGAYHQWKAIKERHALKWTVQNDIAIFEAITDDSHNFEAMLEWLSMALSRLPKQYGSVLVYGALTGLRASEVCYSVNLVRTDFKNYYDKNKGLLTHYKYPNLFIRNTKKAYVSVVTNAVLNNGNQYANKVTYEGLRKAINHVNLPMKMNYTRKIFGTFLKKQGIETEVIDMLQGRLPKSVFLRFYNRPNFQEECNKVRRCLVKLNQKVAQ